MLIVIFSKFKVQILRKILYLIGFPQSRKKKKKRFKKKIKIVIKRIYFSVHSRDIDLIWNHI